MQKREYKKVVTTHFIYYDCIYKITSSTSEKTHSHKHLFQPFSMSDIEISITDIEKTTSDIENLMSDIGNEICEDMGACG